MRRNISLTRPKSLVLSNLRFSLFLTVNLAFFKISEDKQKIKAYQKQLGICPICKQHFEMEEMQADHITPWCEGGPTIDNNCQMLCRDCNRRKSNK